MNRVLITGCSGAGKTTLAKKIAQKYELPLIHLDKIFWQPNWEMPDMNDWHAQVSKIVKSEKWVIEGNYASTFDVRFPRATTLIHLDFPPHICLYRCIKRRLETGKKVRSDMAEGCIERFEWNFYKYVWSYKKKHGPIVYKEAKKLFKGDFIVLKSIKDVKKYIKEINL